MVVAVIDDVVFNRCDCGREAAASSPEGEALVFGPHWRETGCMFSPVLRLAVDLVPAAMLPSDFWDDQPWP